MKADLHSIRENIMRHMCFAASCAAQLNDDGRGHPLHQAMGFEYYYI